MSICRYSENCTACTNWNTPYEEQLTEKRDNFYEIFADFLPNRQIEIKSLGSQGLRHKADFSFRWNSEIQKTEYGYFNKSHELVPISECLQMSPELSLVFKEFIQFNIQHLNAPVQKGSVRLRVGPQGLKGCWLDLANIDIKNLLDDQTYIKKLLATGFKVELGQKSKRVISENEKLTFKEPLAETWFQTPDQNLKALPLLASVSDFTQPSWLSGGELVKIASNWIQKCFTGRKIQITEFGAGIGPFTVNFLSAGHRVHALEVDEKNVEKLKLNSTLNGLQENLKIHFGNFHKEDLDTGSDLYFLNPARSGIKNFTRTILKNRPEYVIYISCFPLSMKEDVSVLAQAYEIQEAQIVDQFPQTDHYEACLLLKRKG